MTAIECCVRLDKALSVENSGMVTISRELLEEATKNLRWAVKHIETLEDALVLLLKPAQPPRGTLKKILDMLTSKEKP